MFDPRRLYSPQGFCLLIADGAQTRKEEFSNRISLRLQKGPWGGGDIARLTKRSLARRKGQKRARISV